MLEQAQQMVPWHILQPTDMPEGYQLVTVEADELHAFAVGPTIVLHYQPTDGAHAQEVSLVELQAASEVSEPVAPGAAREVPVGDTGTTGLFIDARWTQRCSPARYSAVAEVRSPTTWTSRKTMLTPFRSDTSPIPRVQSSRSRWIKTPPSGAR